MRHSDIGMMIFIHMEIDRCIAAGEPVKYILLHQIVTVAGGDESVRESWQRYLTDRNYTEDPSTCSFILDRTSSSYEIGSFPHCDPKVLHQPMECKYCDMHPDWQLLRDAWGINWTGHYVDGKEKCPSEKARPLSIINRWPGNTARPKENT